MSADIERVVTIMQLPAAPETVWRNMMFYEDVPGRPPWLLRTFLPRPLRSVGDKGRVGAEIHCEYVSGQLTKRMTTVEPPKLLRFAVVGQELGVEKRVVAVEGSYELVARGTGTEVRLTTWYRGLGRPRWFWRGLEVFFAHILHRYILGGLRARVASAPRDQEDFASTEARQRNQCAT